MKKVKLSSVSDWDVFQLSPKSKVIYQVIIREKGWVTFTSTSSNKSFKRKGNTICYI